MELDVNVLTNWWTIAGVIASFLVAAVALFLGLTSLVQTRNLKIKERKERLLNEIIEWVSEMKRKAVVNDTPKTGTDHRPYYHSVSDSLNETMIKAELMKLRAKENNLPIDKELDIVWRSAFYCAQLAERKLGNRPINEQMENWSQPARDIIQNIDKIEKQGKLTDEELYNGQRKLLEDISTCFTALVKLEATL